MTGAVAWPPVRRHLRAVRRSHATRSVRDLVGQGYEWALYVFVLGGVVVTALRSSVASLAVPPAGAGVWLGVAALTAGAGSVVAVLGALGPVVVGPAHASWLLPAPLDRTAMLVGRAAAVVAGTAVVVGGIVGLAVAGAGAASPLGAGVAGGLGAAAVVAVCVRAQAGGPGAGRTLALTARTVLVVALLVASVLVVAVRAGVAVPEPAVPGPWPVAVVLAAAALVASAVARRRLDRIRSVDLVRGTPLVAAVTGGAAAADLSITAGALAERRLLRRGTVRSGRHPRGRIRALLRASLRAALRNRQALGAAAALVVLAHVAGVLVPPLFVPAVQFAVVTVVAAAAATPLRAVAGSASLRRDLGGSDRALVTVHAVVPFAAAAVCALLVAPAGGSTASAVLLPVSAVAVVVRHATRPPRAATVTLYESPVGVAIPVETVQDLSRGPALFAVLAGLQIVLGT